MVKTNPASKSGHFREKKIKKTQRTMRVRLPGMRHPSTRPEKLDVRSKSGETPHQQNRLAGNPRFRHRQDRNQSHNPTLRPMPISIHLPATRTRDPRPRYSSPGERKSLSRNHNDVRNRRCVRRREAIYFRNGIGNRDFRDPDGVRPERSTGV